MTIYIDVVLLENICMNYIILFATAYITKTKIKHIRLFVSSLLGAIYAILTYTGIFPLYSNFAVKVILSICMVYIAFAPKNIKNMLKKLILFYLISFTLGGCAFALLYIIRPQDIFMKNGVYIGTYPIKIIFLAGIIGFVITYLSFSSVKNKISKKELIYQIDIKICGRNLVTKVILDTGNMLKEPISGAPVILIERDILKNILPDNLLNNIENILGGDEKNSIDIEYRNRLRVIPFSSIGKDNGIMVGIKSDEVKVITDSDEIVNNEAIICACNKKINKNNKYFGLIGIDLLERSEEYEHIKTFKR